MVKLSMYLVLLQLPSESHSLSSTKYGVRGTAKQGVRTVYHRGTDGRNRMSWYIHMASTVVLTNCSYRRDLQRVEDVQCATPQSTHHCRQTCSGFAPAHLPSALIIRSSMYSRVRCTCRPETEPSHRFLVTHSHEQILKEDTK
jgi:hypothetical protein